MHTTPTNRYLLWLILLFAALIIVSFFAWMFSPSTLPPSQEESQNIVRTPPPAPPFTPDRSAEANAHKVIAALISYTDTGFEPAELTIKKGDTIRFTNNSTGGMLLVSDVSTTQAVTNALPPGEYTEFTFTKEGDKHFGEKGHTSTALIVHVQ